MMVAREDLVEGEGEIAVAHSLPGSYRALRPIMHPAHPASCDASAFSDPLYSWLVRREWFSWPLKLDMSAGEIHDDHDTPTMFHGTEWGAAFQIVRSKAFIVGQGTHGIRGKPMAGCWCVPTLPDALLRCNPARFMDREHGYSRWSCPVVLQLRAVRYVRVPHSTKHCAPGEIGSVHNGLVIDQIHFNTRLMQNFMALETQAVRRSLSDDPRSCVCRCTLCGAYTHANDAGWQKWRKSKKGGYYHPRCYTRVTAHGAQWF